jgi:hypothetical protein
MFDSEGERKDAIERHSNGILTQVPALPASAPLTAAPVAKDKYVFPSETIGHSLTAIDARQQPPACSCTGPGRSSNVVTLTSGRL